MMNVSQKKGGTMKRAVILQSYVFLILAVLFSLGALNAYAAAGHYGISGSLAGCEVCHDFEFGSYAGSGPLRFVLPTINSLPVDFTNFDTPPGTLADGIDSALDGPCEVCHTTTSYHTNTPDGVIHFDGTNCIPCHPHFSDDTDNYFEPTFTGSQSHTTHFTATKGPLLGSAPDCTICHFPSNYALFGPTGETLIATDVCDACHSPDGAIDGVLDAKAKWVSAVYEENGSDLQPGNEDWCAGCHDDGTSIVDSVSAPNVMGNSSTWGYNLTGHGFHDIACEDCHDLAVSHTDSYARSYSASLDNYRSGYRLNENMSIPRNGEIHPAAFRLCTNCHVYTEITGDDSKFRDDGSGMQYHEMHLNWWPAGIWADSDFNHDTTLDSAITCITCHNVHGPPAMAMIRHGELIGATPALDFKWYEEDGATETYNLNESRYGSLLCGLLPNLAYNGVCVGCHATGRLTWFRNPQGEQGITLDAVWTTDTSEVTKTDFYPTEAFQIHTSFTLLGTSGPYFIQVANSAVGNSPSMPGTDWSLPLNKQGTAGSGSFEIQWQGTIPVTAEAGSPAKVRIRIFVFDSQGGTLLDQDEMLWDFNIVTGP